MLTMETLEGVLIPSTAPLEAALDDEPPPPPHPASRKVNAVIPIPSFAIDVSLCMMFFLILAVFSIMLNIENLPHFARSETP